MFGFVSGSFLGLFFFSTEVFWQIIYAKVWKSKIYVDSVYYGLWKIEIIGLCYQ